jgi:glutamate carboxypeptidase
MSLVKYFRERQDEIIGRIRAVVEVESPSRDIAGSRAVVDLLEAQAEKISGVDSAERIPAPGYGEHLLIRAYNKEAANKKHILLIGHTDTVHPRGSLAERPWRIDNGKILAPGIFDMKANCVLLLEVLQGLAGQNLQPTAPVTILLTCDEEIGSPTGRALVEREARQAQACFVFEPSAPGGKAKTGRKGTGNFTLKAHGAASHAGLDPQKGASAILELARQILKLHELNNYDIGTTLTVGLIKGGTATNVVPAEAECEIDVRFTSMPEAARVENEIRSLKPQDERVSLEILGEINRPPLERTPQVVALYEKAKQTARSLGFDLEETQVGGASDGNFVGALGVPVLDGLGITGDGAHSANEHIFPADIPFRGALLATLLTTEL